jgi:tetratricopeptide (TPR) repeat protein
MKQFIIVMLLLLPVFTEAQLQKDKLDSLQLALKNAANDTIRMDVSKQLGFYYNSKNHDSTLFYLEQSAFIAKKLKLKLDEAVALQSEASLFSGSYYPKALELLLRTLKINEDPESEKNVWGLPARLTPHKLRLNSLGWTQRNLAQLYGNTGNTDKQILSLLQAIKLAESVQDSQLNMMANMNLGNVYFEKLKKLDSALYFEQRALSLISKSTVRNNDGWIFSAIGNIYKKEGKFDLAKDAFHKGLRLMQENNNLAGIGGICIALSNFYKTINKPDSSLLYANTALETYKSFKDLAGVANAYSSLSSAYDGQNRIDSAFAYLKLATALHDSLNNVERKNLLVYQNVSFD